MEWADAAPELSMSQAEEVLELPPSRKRKAVTMIDIQTQIPNIILGEQIGDIYLETTELQLATPCKQKVMPIIDIQTQIPNSILGEQIGDIYLETTELVIPDPKRVSARELFRRMSIFGARRSYYTESSSSKLLEMYIAKLKRRLGNYYRKRKPSQWTMVTIRVPAQTPPQPDASTVRPPLGTCVYKAKTNGEIINND